MFKKKKEKIKQLHYYTKTINVDTANVVFEYTSDETIEELSDYYYKVLSKNEAFEEYDQNEKQYIIFNPNNVNFINIKEKNKEEEIELL